MPKYYVQSGEMSRVQDADSPQEAAVKALRRETKEKEDLSLAIIVGVNEMGFDFNPCADCEFDPELEATDPHCQTCEYREALDNMFLVETGTLIGMAGLSSQFRLHESCEGEESEDC